MYVWLCTQKNWLKVNWDKKIDQVMLIKWLEIIISMAISGDKTLYQHVFGDVSGDLLSSGLHDSGGYQWWVIASIIKRRSKVLDKC